MSSSLSAVKLVQSLLHHQGSSIRSTELTAQEPGHSDIGVTMNNYTHLSLEDAKEEMIRMEELNAARSELNKTTGEKPVTQKMFRAI